MTNKAAFTLVELSIVLVILGLLVGGVLAGQNLIRAAELRSVTTEFANYQTAVMTFKEKYFALPGDMDNAEAFWGSMTNCGVASPSGSGTQTCNGDADGILDNASAASRTGENFAFWKQLANAGLIEGTYTGIAGSSGTHGTAINENIPASKLSSAGWSVYFHTAGTIMDLLTPVTSNVMIFGGALASAPTWGYVITPEEAWNIDTKIDDGLPGGGVVQTFQDGTFSGVNCVTTADPSTAVYELSVSDNDCTLVFKKF